MKRCTDCEQELELSEFGKSSRAKDGKQSKCRECVAEYNASPAAKAARAKHKATAKRKETDKAYRARPEYRAEQAERSRTHRAENPEKIAAQNAKYRVDHPDRLAANRAVITAVKQGRLPAASTVTCYRRYDGCKIQADDWHHHSGYDEAHHLAVLSICKPCHKKEHKEARV